MTTAFVKILSSNNARINNRRKSCIQLLYRLFIFSLLLSAAFCEETKVQNSQPNKKTNENSAAIDFINRMDSTIKLNSQKELKAHLQQILNDSKENISPGKKVSDKEIELLIQRINKVESAYNSQELSVENNTFYEVMLSIFAFGSDKKISYHSSNDCNSIDIICQGIELGGSNGFHVMPQKTDANKTRNYSVFYNSETTSKKVPLSNSGILSMRNGYYLQTAPGEFLAILAAIQVPIDRPIVVDGMQFTVADIVEEAKRYNIEGDMSFLLSALSYYCQKISWKNSNGETIKIEDLLKHEMFRVKDMKSNEITNCLYGIVISRNNYISRRFSYSPKAYRALDIYLKYHLKLALSQQTSDHGWSSTYFVKKDNVTDFESTSDMASWIIPYVSVDMLNDSRIFGMIQFLVKELENRQQTTDLTSYSLNQTRTLFKTLRTVILYKQRITNRS